MKCLFCNQDFAENQDANTKVYDCNCPNCGHYKLSEIAYQGSSIRDNPDLKGKKHLISGCIYEMNERGDTIDLITPNNVTNFLKSPWITKSVNDQFERALRYIKKRTSYLYQVVEISLDRPAIAYARHRQEFENIFKALKELDYISSNIETQNHESVYLTIRGMARISEMDQVSVKSKQCFVAMWFNKEMQTIFDTTISRAVRDLGYDPVIITMKEFNDDITDNIIAEIRKSKFMIADFTGNRGGVYFEAGFASGLGLPVILTCQKDLFEKEHVHFDVSHFNFIVWENESDLYTKLKNRIRATILVDKHTSAFQI